MLSILIAWLFCGFIFLTCGKILIDISRFFLKGGKCGLCDTFFIGVTFVGTLLSIASLFVPINTISAWCLFAVSVLYSLYLLKFRKENILVDVFGRLKSMPIQAQLLSFLVLLLIVSFCLMPPFLVDMGLYYMQSMLWNETYSVIPGLGNLHGRFGFNSNILLLSSAFNMQDVFSFRIYGILGLSTFVFFMWIISKIVQSKSSVVRLGLVLFCFAFVSIYQSFISSPSTDILPNVLVAYILLRAIFDKQSIFNSPLLFLLLPVYAVTLKLSVIPICFFSIYVLINEIRRKQYKIVLLLTMLGFIVIIPWCVRTIIITGYLIYPFPSLDFFSFDWKIPYELADMEKRLVSSWAKMPGLGYAEFEQMSFGEWGKVWLLRHLKYAKISLFAYIVAGLSPLALFIMWKKKLVKNYLSLFIWGVAFCGYIFWLILAPDGRFGLSFILVSALIPLFLIEYNYKNKILKNVAYVFFALLLIGNFSESFRLNSIYKKDKSLLSYFYSPQNLSVVNEMNKTEFSGYQLGELTIYYPSNMLCSDHDLPCVPFYSENIEMRGKKIEEGFKYKE